MIKKGKVYILSDKKGIGKTTALQNWIKNNRKFRGVLSPIVNGRRMFQIIGTDEFIPMETESKDLSVGKYVFDKRSFEIAENSVRKALLDDKNPVMIIDEIGPLEINKNLGLHNLVNKLIPDIQVRELTLIFVVRISCLKEFIEKYNLPKAEVLDLKSFNDKFLINN